jgi:hypothetical protein
VRDFALLLVTMGVVGASAGAILVVLQLVKPDFMPSLPIPFVLLYTVVAAVFAHIGLRAFKVTLGGVRISETQASDNRFERSRAQRRVATARVSSATASENSCSARSTSAMCTKDLATLFPRYSLDISGWVTKRRIYPLGNRLEVYNVSEILIGTNIAVHGKYALGCQKPREGESFE